MLGCTKRGRAATHPLEAIVTIGAALLRIQNRVRGRWTAAEGVLPGENGRKADGSKGVASRWSWDGCPSVRNTSWAFAAAAMRGSKSKGRGRD